MTLFHSRSLTACRRWVSLSLPAATYGDLPDFGWVDRLSWPWVKGARCGARQEVLVRADMDNHMSRRVHRSDFKPTPTPPVGVPGSLYLPEMTARVVLFGDDGEERERFDIDLIRESAWSSPAGMVERHRMIGHCAGFRVTLYALVGVGTPMVGVDGWAVYRSLEGVEGKVRFSISIGFDGSFPERPNAMGELVSGGGVPLHLNWWRSPLTLPGREACSQDASQHIDWSVAEEWADGLLGPHKPQVRRQFPCMSVRGGHGRIKGMSQDLSSVGLMLLRSSEWERPVHHIDASGNVLSLVGQGIGTVNGMLPGCSKRGWPRRNRGLVARGMSLYQAWHPMLDDQLEFTLQADMADETHRSDAWPEAIATGRLLQEWAWYYGVASERHQSMIGELIVDEIQLARRYPRLQNGWVPHEESFLCDGVLAVIDGASECLPPDAGAVEQWVVGRADRAVREGVLHDPIVRFLPRVPDEPNAGSPLAQWMTGAVEVLLRYGSVEQRTMANKVCRYLYPSNEEEYEWICGATEVSRALGL